MKVEIEQKHSQKVVIFVLQLRNVSLIKLIKQCKGSLQKQNCIFYDIWQIRLLTYLPHPNLDKIIYGNLIDIFDLPPLQEFGQSPENIWFLRYTIYVMTSLMSCQFRQDFYPYLYNNIGMS